VERLIEKGLIREEDASPAQDVVQAVLEEVGDSYNPLLG